LALLDHPLVRYAATPAELPEAVQQALVTDRQTSGLRRAYALENTWEHRASRLEALLAARRLC
jgi:hypothetical protein